MEEEFRPAKQHIPVLFRGRIVPGVFGEIQSFDFVPANNPEDRRIVLTTTRHHWYVLDLEIQRAIRRISSSNLRRTITPAPHQNFARYGVIIYYAVGDENYLPEEMGLVDISDNVTPDTFRSWAGYDSDDEYEDEAPPDDEETDNEDEQAETESTASSVSTETGRFLERVLRHSFTPLRH